jgi:hypothetical protein
MESPGASSLRRGQQVEHGKYLEYVSETEEHECSGEDAEPAPQFDPIELRVISDVALSIESAPAELPRAL